MQTKEDILKMCTPMYKGVPKPEMNQKIKDLPGPIYATIYDYPITDIRAIFKKGHIVCYITTDGHAWSQASDTWLNRKWNGSGIFVAPTYHQKSYSVTLMKEMGKFWIPNPEKFIYVVPIDDNHLNLNLTNWIWSPTKVYLIGKRFGSLVVTRVFHNGRRTACECLCDCGNTASPTFDHLKSGHTNSCGCYRIDKITTHGKCYTHIYNCWKGMVARCTNPNDVGWDNYGGRPDDEGGPITVCEDWCDLAKFEQWANANGYDETLTIDRKDNFKGYSPENCRWVVNSIQNSNRRFHTESSLNGEVMSLKTAANRLKVPVNKLAWYHHNHGTLDGYPTPT